jgi:hypothetical protein
LVIPLKRSGIQSLVRAELFRSSVASAVARVSLDSDAVMADSILSTFRA